MASPSSYPVSPAWLLIMRDIGIHPGDVLRRAGIAVDLLAREHATIRGEEFCRLLWALDAEVADRTLPIKVAQALSFEMFDPPVFAAMCSPDLNTALQRLSHYKRLCAPVALDVTVEADVTRVRPRWNDPPSEPPPLLFAMELAYCVKLARLGTREPIVARRVTASIALEPAAAYEAYFGCPVERGGHMTVEFAAADARAPFLTARAGMWSFFEPELRRRLAEVEAAATTKARTRAALFELLPSARASVHAVAGLLGISARTLQRRLMEEDTSFQAVLDGTREELARHYLGTTAMAGAEISFLLGFEDPNSFVRAFHDWTGKTPEQVRTQLRRQEA
ncbi:MAG TPA: AraC family transcriptional regulator ligand-binding domain-containing protein [Kofleriaceae bacterium]|nr:AraC family transcriptional regulator ligand-binding domain-containing protein [Kofleriaceae bacterium]